MSVECAEWVLSFAVLPQRIWPPWVTADVWYEAMAVLLSERAPA